MIDLGQYDAMKKETLSEIEQLKVFERHKKRLAVYLRDYIAEEQDRGNVEIDQFMIFDAIDAFYGGAK